MTMIEMCRGIRKAQGWQQQTTTVTSRLVVKTRGDVLDITCTVEDSAGPKSPWNTSSMQGRHLRWSKASRDGCCSPWDAFCGNVRQDNSALWKVYLL